MMSKNPQADDAFMNNEDRLEKFVSSRTEDERSCLLDDGQLPLAEVVRDAVSLVPSLQA